MAVVRMVVVCLCLSVALLDLISLSFARVPCEDHHPRCGHWTSKGECRKNPQWMLKHCKVSCGQCAQANVHDLYNHATLEIRGGIFLVIGIVMLVLVITFMRIYFEGPSCPSKAKLAGKTVVITGANTGIGKETARILAWRKARVIMGCRNISKGLQAAAEIIQNTGNRNVEVKKLDLSSFRSVRTFAEEINEEEERVDVLINNAGYMGPYKTTVDGFENNIQVNYLSHFLLSHLLFDKLKASSPSRIINVTSVQHTYIKELDANSAIFPKKEAYRLFGAYNVSKFCQVISTLEMSRRFEGSGVTVNALHPGIVKTEIDRNFRVLRLLWFLKPVVWIVSYLFFKTLNGGAQTSVYCAVAEELKDVSGCYFKDCEMADCNTLAKDNKLAKELWILSERVTEVKSA